MTAMRPGVRQSGIRRPQPSAAPEVLRAAEHERALLHGQGERHTDARAHALPRGRSGRQNAWSTGSPAGVRHPRGTRGSSIARCPTHPVRRPPPPRSASASLSGKGAPARRATCAHSQPMPSCASRRLRRQTLWFRPAPARARTGPGPTPAARCQSSSSTRSRNEPCGSSRWDVRSTLAARVAAPHAGLPSAGRPVRLLARDVEPDDPESADRPEQRCRQRDTHDGRQVGVAKGVHNTAKKSGTA